jgi:hypothetical protein
MIAERFVYEYANYCKRRWKEMAVNCPALEKGAWKERIDERIQLIDKYVKARERGLITPQEAVEQIGKV